MNIVKRIAIGIALMLLAAVSLTAAIVPGGTLKGRTTLHADETTTTTTAPPTTATTTGTSPVETAPVTAQPIITTTTTRPAATAPLHRHRPVVSTTTSPLRTAGEHPCPSGDWAPDC